MNCLEFNQYLEDHFLEDPPPEAQSAHGPSSDTAEFRAHRAECEACRRIWDDLRTLDDAIGAWRNAVPVCSLTESVLASFVPAPATNPEVGSGGQVLPAPRSDRSVIKTAPRAKSWIAGLAGLAAAFVLGWGLPAFWPAGGNRTVVETRLEPVDGDGRAQPALASHAGEHPEGAVPETTPSLKSRNPSSPGTRSPAAKTLSSEASDVEVRALVHDAGIAYLDLAESTASVLRDAAGLLPSVSSGSSSEPPLPAASLPSGTEWIDDLGDGLKPIGNSVGQAFDFLWRTQSERAEG